MYLEFACCAAVPGGGRNKEYAMHLLHICRGNIHVSFGVSLLLNKHYEVLNGFSLWTETLKLLIWESK